ncbi:MAG: MFS transporter [Bacteroidales bacterium]|nr:major facilitator superfamily domain-containing protein 1 [Bacteroidales bacterium]MBQ8573454.1 MFS transporter [Bacteroidales bacterium]MBR1959271.1 MFS transporter [Bacteroidales bacterium]
MSTLKNTLRDSRWARWLALACLVVPMFASYFFDDMFSSLSELFKNPEMLELGWDMADYGFYASGYSFLCIWGGLIICGALLDKFGVRLVGSIFVGMMAGGAALVTFAISAGFKPDTSLTIAYIGCMLFGLGSEIAGVSVTRSIAKWFKGRNMALAMGLQLAIARFGTATAILIAPMIVAQKPAGEIYTLADTNRPALIGLAVLAVGVILWAVFVAMDAGYDRQTGETDKVETAEEDKFRFSDIWRVLSNPRFLMIAILCVTFYCCVIRFKKFGVSILLPLFGVNLDIATVLLAMIPFFTILFTPLFGALVDKVGKATLWLIIGSALVLASHLIITYAPQGVPVYAYIAIALLGIGYSLVPSAMWPSVPKIIPEKNLGTAYSLIYWVQNLGMWAVPIYIGRIFTDTITEAGNHAQEVQAAISAEYIFILLGIIAIGVSVMLLVSSRRHPELRLDEPARK